MILNGGPVSSLLIVHEAFLIKLAAMNYMSSRDLLTTLTIIKCSVDECKEF